MSELWITEVGSTMWKMADLASDRDRIIVYQEPTKNILGGWHYEDTKPHKPVRVENGVDIDEQAMEIGHLINLLVKGNINAIWAVCSPIIIKNSPVLHLLRGVVQSEMSKASAASIKGMSVSQAADTEKRPVMATNSKGLRTAIRTLRFGITMMNEHKFVFEPISYLNVTDAKRIYTETLKDFEESIKNSTLPERPDENRLRDILFNLRVGELEGVIALEGVKKREHLLEE
jgi:predicted nucleotidyltransferase